MAEVVGNLYEERPNYTFNELVADIGGSLGLVLGLSMIDIFVFGRTMCRVARRRITKLTRKPTCSQWHKINNDVVDPDNQKTRGVMYQGKSLYIDFSKDEILTKL